MLLISVKYENWNLIKYMYVDCPNILHTTTDFNDSPTWSSIIHTKDALKDGFSRRARLGSSSFWSCHWSSLWLLDSLAPYIHIHNLHLEVKDLFFINDPHIHTLHTHILLMASKFINNMHIKFNYSESGPT